MPDASVEAHNASVEAHNASVERATQAVKLTEPIDPIMQYFDYAHLPVALMEVSKPFGVMANVMVATLPRCAERTAGLRKLLEAKDCAVRAKLYKP